MLKPYSVSDSNENKNVADRTMLPNTPPESSDQTAGNYVLLLPVSLRKPNARTQQQWTDACSAACPDISQPPTGLPLCLCC